MVPLINGVAYSWADINIFLLGRTVLGISGISYEEEQDITDNYGSGQYATSRGYGQFKFKATLKMEMKEVERLQAAVPSGRLSDIPPFPITVSYVNVANKTVVHKLIMCQFKNNKRDTKSGETNIEVELDLVIANIEWK